MDEKFILNNLSLLKNCIIEFNNITNIYFYDKISYYIYLDNIHSGQKSARELLDEIYPCIPLLLTEEAYNYFEKSCDEFKPEVFENFSKADFFEYASKNIENWSYIEKLCLSINIYMNT